MLLGSAAAEWRSLRAPSRRAGLFADVTPMKAGLIFVITWTFLVPGVVTTAQVIPTRASWVRGGPGCLNRISASISGASAGVRLPSGGAAA